MSNSSTVVIGALMAGIALRVALNVSSLSRPNRLFDLAYGVLFLAIGVFVLFVEPSALWALLMLVIAIWYLFRGLRADTTRPRDDESP